MSASDVMRDNSGHVIYKLTGEKVYHGSEVILYVSENTPYLIRVRDSERRDLFDLIDRDVLKRRNGGCVFSHNSNYFEVETFGRKVQIKGSKHGKFLELDARISTWKIAVLIYNKLQREEEAAAEQKALKEDAKARGIYTGELHEAICDLRTTAVEIEEMVKSHPDWLFERDEDKRLPIHLGVMRRDTEILNVLLDNGGEKCINIPDSAGMTPLILAIYHRNSKALRLLLERGVDVNRFNPFDKRSPLRYALGWRQETSNFTPGVDYTRTELVKDLISHGATIDKDSEEGSNLLVSAASVADLESVTLFLDAGIDVNVKVDGSTSLYMALMRSVTEKEDRDEAFRVADFLISRGADVNCLNQSGGRCDNLLCFAVVEQDDRLVDYLLSKGVDVDCKNEQGYTPLDVAVSLLSFHMVKKLRAAGAHGTKSALKKAFLH